jgi:uncharacterized cupredoxin-like copper-binding protein
MSATRFVSALVAMTLVTAGALGATAPAEPLVIKLQDSTTDASIAHMRMVLSSETIKPGRVTLRAENQSKSLVHEVVVVRDEGGRKLPFDSKQDRVVEGKLHSLGEIADLHPGKSGTLTLNLKAGHYLLLCNQPGHYKDGMVAKLTVAP